jgi:hypothetical protein
MRTKRRGSTSGPTSLADYARGGGLRRVGRRRRGLRNSSRAVTSPRIVVAGSAKGKATSVSGAAFFGVRGAVRPGVPLRGCVRPEAPRRQGCLARAAPRRTNGLDCSRSSRRPIPDRDRGRRASQRGASVGPSRWDSRRDFLSGYPARSAGSAQGAGSRNTEHLAAPLDGRPSGRSPGARPVRRGPVRQSAATPTAPSTTRHTSNATFAFHTRTTCFFATPARRAHSRPTSLTCRSPQSRECARWAAIPHALADETFRGRFSAVGPTRVPGRFRRPL